MEKLRIIRNAYRKYFWNKKWYQHFILYKWRNFCGKSYLKDGWHTKTELEYIQMDIIRLEKKVDMILDKLK